MLHNYYDPNYDQNYMNYCLMEAQKMYPELYHRIYAHVRRVCEREDCMYNQHMYPFPSKEIVDRMTDEVVEAVTKEQMYRSPNGHLSSGDVLRAFIGALLIRELLDRRRPRRRPRPYY